MIIKIFLIKYLTCTQWFTMYNVRPIQFPIRFCDICTVSIIVAIRSLKMKKLSLSQAL